MAMKEEVILVFNAMTTNTFPGINYAGFAGVPSKQCHQATV